MTKRFLVPFLAFLWIVSGTGPLPSAGDGGASWGRAEAAPRKAKAKAKAKARAKPRRPRAAAVSPLPDDPSVPLGTAWQKNLDRFFAQHRPQYGAFVAMDPSTGELLAVSEYSASPSTLAHPATSGSFPAASIFKVITAAALLEKTPVEPGTTVCYRGGSHSLEEAHLQDRKTDRACRSLAAAFAHSTNAVFGKLAVKHLEAKDLVAMAERFGFNQVLKVGSLETRGRATLAGSRLALGRMAAGFVNSSMSALQGAVIGAVIAAGGVMPPGLPMPEDGGPVIGSDTVRELRAMMTATSTGGTASRYLAGIAARGGGVAVKTGTLSSRDGSGLLNTWMVGFFPANRPEIAFAAHIATPGGGPVKAGLLTRFALETYLKLKKARMGQS